MHANLSRQESCSRNRVRRGGRGRDAHRAAEKKQQAYYSGKKKRHTLKSQVVINGRTRQVICTHHGRGPVHDFALYGRSKVEPHESLEVLADSGYQGLAKLHAKSRTPHKKPRESEFDRRAAAEQSETGEPPCRR